jgi:hypothetical protein
MTVEERVLAVQALGFLPRQARFLMTVALHSGYCLRRHYTAFTGTQNGKNAQHFLQGLVTRGLASQFTFRADRGHVFHLHARSLYRALGQENDRNRRHVSAARIARKLMLLDVVLGQPDADWLGTEADKVACFTQRFQITESDLPRRTLLIDKAHRLTRHYFTDKLPIGIVGVPPVVHFVYLAMEADPRPFTRFLADHARLLSGLSAWAVVVAHPNRVVATPLWEAAFARFIQTPVPFDRDKVRDLKHYFVTRRHVEREEWTRVSVKDLQGFRKERQRFADPAIDAAFSRWVASGADRLDPTLLAGHVLRSGRLIVQPLTHTYEQFGAYAGVL